MSAYAMFARGNPTGGPFGFGASFAYAQKHIGSLNEEIWLTSMVAFTSGSIDTGDSSSTASIQAITNPASYLITHPTLLEGINRISDAGFPPPVPNPSDRWSSNVASDLESTPSPVQLANKWYILENFFHRGTASGAVVTCDGSWSRSSGQTWDLPATDISAGCFGTVISDITGLTTDKAFEVYVGHVMCGTSRHGNDIFDNDFGSGDFSAWDFHTAWDGTYGCTIVAKPDFSAADPDNCNAFSLYTVVNGTENDLIDINSGGTDVSAMSARDGITLRDDELAALASIEGVAVTADLSGLDYARPSKKLTGIAALYPNGLA